MLLSNTNHNHLSKKIIERDILEGLVDITGGISEKWNLTETDTKKKIENN
jgi:hypothetical protein